MLPIRTILFATDFSDCSAYAQHVVTALARDYKAHVVTLYVLPTPAMVYGDGFVPPDIGDRAELEKAELAKLDLPEGSRRLFAEGDPVETILQEAHDHDADLIVLGTHGRTGLGRLLMGSVAEQVLRRADCPVLTVRKPVAERAREAAPLAEPALEASAV